VIILVWIFSFIIVINQENREATMERLMFATISASGRLTKEALLFIESLRTFGENFADYAVILLTPAAAGPLSDEDREKCDALNVRLIPFDVDEDARKFPFASLVYASAEAEKQVKGASEILVWMLADTLVIQPPRAFSLREEIDFSYRPVHHTLVGSVYEKPLDDFWTLIYRHCGITDDRVFPMETCVRDYTIRPYFNAGMLVVRPEQGLLSEWRDHFDRLYRHPDFEPFYEKDIRYKIFMHQAVLAGVVLNMFEQEKLQELPEAINYPLHLHGEYPPKHRPKALNDLITCRYEGVNELPGFLKKIQTREPLKSWLNARLDK
jgi:hypothetical protein